MCKRNLLRRRKATYDNNSSHDIIKGKYNVLILLNYIVLTSFFIKTLICIMHETRKEKEGKKKENTKV